MLYICRNVTCKNEKQKQLTYVYTYVYNCGQDKH